MRFHSVVPISFWGDCLLSAAYLINRTSSFLLNGITPYEVLFKTPPNFADLRVFSCLCFATVVPRSTGEFATRAVKGVFIGYPFAIKGYKVLDLQTNKVFIARDVTFYETVFPFKDISHTMSQPTLFPSTVTFIDCEPLVSTLVVPSQGSDSDTVTSSTVGSTVPVATPLLVNRPTRTRQLPFKFTDYTGIPAHLCNTIQLHTASTSTYSS